jgi:hypothetical protein
LTFFAIFGIAQSWIVSPFVVAIIEPLRAQSPQRFKKAFFRVLGGLCGKFGM